MDAIGKIHQFQRFGSILGLSRMNLLLEKLGNPQEQLSVIHVAGTNGKGSICKYIYEVLQAGGYKTGLYTSPFLEVFNERIEFNGEYISNEDLNLYTDLVLEKSKEMVDEGNESPTEFEIVTAIAFIFFKEKNADYVVLEVGLGGRGDSTNVVDSPLVSIIGSISFDHTDRLGNTISEIAGEKAGIIKAGCPVVTSSNREAAKEVFCRKAKALKSKLYDTSSQKYEITGESLEGYSFSTNILGQNYSIDLSMSGIHQIENAIAALYALTLLNLDGKVKLAPSDIQAGFKKAKQIGRFEVMRRHPYIIIDGAHNPDGAEALKRTVKKHFDGQKILMVVGILADKSDQLLDNFTEITKDFVVTEPGNPRKMTACDLEEKLAKRGGNCKIIETPKDAAEYAISKQGEYDLILFAGSLYLIGEIRGYIKDEKGNTFLQS